METIINKVRDLCGDLLITTGRQSFDFDAVNSSKIFTLQDSTVVTASVAVAKNGVVWSDDNYTYDPNTIQITVDEESGEELEVGDNLLVTYSYYKKYCDNEIKAYIRSALYYISNEHYKTFAAKNNGLIFPTPTEIEENLIATIAVILMGENIKSYKTQDVQVVFLDSDPIEVRIMKFVRKFKKSYGVLEYTDLNANWSAGNEENEDYE